MDYTKDLILVISACGTDKQRMTNEITKLYKLDSNIKPPSYVVVFDEDETSWKDAVLARTIFYHQMDEINIKKKSKVKNLINRIQEAEFGNIIYRRWDKKEKKYLRYPSKEKVE
jgi:putative component of toxin-antitoxin plasmid stabilization module